MPEFGAGCSSECKITCLIDKASFNLDGTYDSKVKGTADKGDKILNEGKLSRESTCVRASEFRVFAISDDGKCKLSDNPRAAMEAMHIPISDLKKDFSGHWDVPFISSECKGMRVRGTSAALYSSEGIIISNEVIPSGSFTFTSCGDGIKDPGEQCDDDTIRDTYYIDKDPYVDEANDNDGRCIYDDTRNYVCKLNTCGDGYLNSPVEECDLGPDNGKGICATGCKLAICDRCNTCGDGITALIEEKLSKTITAGLEGGGAEAAAKK